MSTRFRTIGIFLVVDEGVKRERETIKQDGMGGHKDRWRISSMISLFLLPPHPYAPSTSEGPGVRGGYEYVYVYVYVCMCVCVNASLSLCLSLSLFLYLSLSRPRACVCCTM